MTAKMWAVALAAFMWGIAVGIWVEFLLVLPRLSR